MTRLTSAATNFDRHDQQVCFEFDYYLFGPNGSIPVSYVLLNETHDFTNVTTFWLRDENFEYFDKVTSREVFMN